MEMNKTVSEIVSEAYFELEEMHMKTYEDDKITVVTLDWDVSFDTYKASNNMRELIRFTVNHKNQIAYIAVRQSASGNCHVKILTYPITTFEMFQWRAILRDDYRRIVIDLKRLYEQREYNRLWDFKMMDDGSENVVRAGNWQSIYTINNGWL